MGSAEGKLRPSILVLLWALVQEASCCRWLVGKE